MKLFGCCHLWEIVSIVNDFQNFVSFNEIIWLLVDSTNSIMFGKIIMHSTTCFPRFWRQSGTDYGNETEALRKTKLFFLDIAVLIKYQPEKDKSSLGILKHFVKCKEKHL